MNLFSSLRIVNKYYRINITFSKLMNISRHIPTNDKPPIVSTPQPIPFVKLETQLNDTKTCSGQIIKQPSRYHT